MNHVRSCSATVAILALALFAQTAPAASAEPDAPQMQAQQAARDFSFGPFEDAIQGWGEAAAAYAASGESKGQIQALLGKGNAYLALGRHARSLV